jgi:tyrosyl-tRNA synthetase
MIARYLVKMGHKAIIILGTTTAKIGDPSLKSEQRKLLSAEAVEENYNSISKIITKFIQSEDNPPIFLKNDWLEEAGLVDFLVKYGSHFSVNRMVSMETFSERLKNHRPLSFLEFSYSLFQAYDFAHLYKKYNCQLQIGGSDQWGNIVAGLDLCQKLHNGSEVFGATVNLLLNSSGEKMGKTVGGAVWLNSDMFEPFDYWQYFRNVDDADIMKIMNLLTDVSDEEIDRITDNLRNISNAKEINEIKILLATKVTEICHGVDVAKQVEFNSRAKFSQSDDFSNANPDLILSEKEIDNLTFIEFIKKLTPENSNSQIKTLISQNSIRINGDSINDLMFKITSKNFKHFDKKNFCILEVGKKKKFVIEIKD